MLGFLSTAHALEQIDAMRGFTDYIQKNHPHLLEDLKKIDWNQIQYQIQKRTVPVDHVDHEVRKFERSMAQILKTLKESGGEPGDSNQQLISQLRKTLESPIYQALKEDFSQPSIHFFHRLASDIWNKAPSLDGYHQVGKSVLRELHQEEAPQMSGQQLAAQLEASQKKMTKIHWSDQGISKLFYAITHPLQAMGGLASEGGIAREIPAMVGLDEYDSHGTLSNNPSLQGVTTLPWIDEEGAEFECQVNNCYGGSPTIGDYHIAPEFEAAIQSGRE